MTNNWAEWDRERARNGRLTGKMTSKEGLAKLDKAEVTLSSHRGSGDGSTYTIVMHRGNVIGDIDHPIRQSRHFQPRSKRLHMEESGTYTQMHDLGRTATHDQAVQAILNDRGIKVDKTTSAERLASTITGPMTSSRVSGPYQGKREAPRKGMGEAARNADSVATRIRMNSARTDPLTGEQLTKDTRSADKIAANVLPTAPTRLKSLYGSLLKVHRTKNGDENTVDRHLESLSTSPVEHHKLVAKHIGEVESGGIHVGNKRAIDMKGTFTHDIHSSGGTVLSDRPDDRIGGVFSPGHRQLVVPEDTGLSGSVSTASHEFGHALDLAYGSRLSGRDIPASKLPDFQQVYREVSHMHDNSKTQLNPYYTDASTSHGPVEMWAEAYAAWLHGAQKRLSPEEQAMFIGKTLGAAPGQRGRTGEVLRRYFERNSQKMKDLTNAG